MTILYAVVARKTTVLAKYAGCAGNFSEVTDQVLSNIQPDSARLTYTHGSYLFHYVQEEGLIYLCITDSEFERSKAFSFLNEIKKRFVRQYGPRAQTALPFAMNSEFSRVLSGQMRHYSSGKDVDQMSQVQGQLDELKDIMVKNIDTVASRGERLELLVDKAEDLSHSAMSFKKTSRGLARAMCLKNAKITIIIVVVVLIILFSIIVAGCGGFSFKRCK
ncbi:vesicle-associated membrane protein 7-like [Sycon ciliatum]|uniref:vesicle-associated membrane protein 7-like n=1 Tax=Sycon ciliatum TaxID=27933 RepID=UPI0020ADB0C0|eukprot:scpid80895/ scgid17318/ Vesicle-associated membrane protein 7; Synaptobrevin-like protein 1